VWSTRGSEAANICIFRLIDESPYLSTGKTRRAIVTITGSFVGEPALDAARVACGGNVGDDKPDESAHDDSEIHDCGTSDPGQIVDRLRDGVAQGLILPRDASIAAGRMGLKVLPEGNSDADALYGITSRQGRTTTHRVSESVREGDGDDPSQARDAESSLTPTPDPAALVGAELALSPSPHRLEGMRALDVLNWQDRGQPVRRTSTGGGPVPGSTRVRQHRYRSQIRARMRSVASDPARSVGAPYLVLPMTLSPRLVEQVPQAQRRRGRPPELDWLALQVAALNRSYAERDTTFKDLASIVRALGFCSVPGQPRSLFGV
jgi:hypothetical protein